MAPACTTALGTAMNVNAGSSTSSPGRTPLASRARKRAELHELTATAYRAPRRSANSRSNRAVSLDCGDWQS